MRRLYWWVLGCLLVQLAFAVHAYRTTLPEFEYEVGALSVLVGLISFAPVSRLLNGRRWGPPRIDKGWELVRAAPIWMQAGLVLLVIPYMAASLLSIAAPQGHPVSGRAPLDQGLMLGIWFTLAAAVMLHAVLSSHEQGTLVVSPPRRGLLRPVGIIGFVLGALLTITCVTNYGPPYDSPLASECRARRHPLARSRCRCGRGPADRESAAPVEAGHAVGHDSLRTQPDGGTGLGVAERLAGLRDDLHRDQVRSGGEGHGVRSPAPDRLLDAVDAHLRDTRPVEPGEGRVGQRHPQHALTDRHRHLLRSSSPESGARWAGSRRRTCLRSGPLRCPARRKRLPFARRYTCPRRLGDRIQPSGGDDDAAPRGGS